MVSSWLYFWIWSSREIVLESIWFVIWVLSLFVTCLLSRTILLHKNIIPDQYIYTYPDTINMNKNYEIFVAHIYAFIQSDKFQETCRNQIGKKLDNTSHNIIS